MNEHLRNIGVLTRVYMLQPSYSFATTSLLLFIVTSLLHTASVGRVTCRVSPPTPLVFTFPNWRNHANSPSTTPAASGAKPVGRAPVREDTQSGLTPGAAASSTCAWSECLLSLRKAQAGKHLEEGYQSRALLTLRVARGGG